jgi:O-antigen/teichoic acid export membrane protein
LVPVSALVNNLLETLRAYEKINSFSFIFNILQNVVKIVALGLFMYFAIFSNSNKVIFSYSLAILSMLIAGYYAVRKNIPELLNSFKLNEVKKKNIRKEVLDYSIPLLFSGIITSLFYWVDSLSLGYLRDVTSVGFYNAAVPIAMLLLLIPEIFMQLFKPLINKEYGRNNKILIREISKQVTKWIFIIALPVFMLLFVFPGAAINILFGESYLVAENALRLLSLGALITAISVVPGHLLLMKGKSNLTFVNILLATILNVVLNFVFIPLQSIVGMDNASGLNGAALATFVSAAFLAIIQFWQAKRYTGIIPLRRKMLAIFLVSLVSLYLLVYVKDLLTLTIFNVAILCVGFLILYFGLVLLTRGFDGNDYMIIKSIKNKVIGVKR